MAYCSNCGVALVRGQRFCAACGTRLSMTPTPPPAADATQTSVPETPMPPPRSDGKIDVRFLPGTMLTDRYRIIGLLGRGGMGEVYRADDLKLGSAVALKFLPERFEQDANRLARFLNEVRVALRVSHVNVCRVHDIGDVDGRPYISMEYVDGEDLASLLRRIGHFPADRGLKLAEQICAGLTAAHEQGVLHRDLKPANVMLDGRGMVKITDFGLATLAEELQDGEIGVGTPAYMAPEQFVGGGTSQQSDIYALGLVLYELFTGQPAYTAQTLADIRHRHETPPSRPSSWVDDLNPALDVAILACLEADPARRPTTARNVGEALELEEAPGVALERDPNRLLIHPFEVRGPSEANDFIGQSLAEALAINLATVPQFQVLPVPRAEEAGRTAARDLAIAGRKHGAGRVVHGSLTREGRNVELTFFLVDTADERIVGGGQESLENVDLSTMAASVAREITKTLGASVSRRYEQPKSMVFTAEQAADPAVVEAVGAQRRGDFKAYLVAVRRMLQRFPDDPDVHAQHVNARYENWRPEPSPKNRAAVEQALVRLGAIDPQSAYLDLFRGQLAYEGDGRPRVAIAAFDRTLERNDLSPTCRAWVLRNRAQPLQMVGRVEEAMQDLREAIKLAPVEPWNFYALGTVLCWSREFERALAEARRAVAFEPWDYRHHMVVAQALVGLAQWGEGLDHGNKAYEGSRAQGAAALRAVCLQGLGRSADARAAAEAAAELADSADGWVYLARYRAMLGEEEEALRCLEKAAETGLATLDFVEDFPELEEDERFRRVVAGVRARGKSV